VPYHPGDRVEASTVLGHLPAVVVAVYPAEGTGPAVYAVEPDPPAGGFPRLLLGATHLLPADRADEPHLVPAGGR
jgi:hypothetical protein